jgi:hypothetical protein
MPRLAEGADGADLERNGQSRRSEKWSRRKAQSAERSWLRLALAFGLRRSRDGEFQPERLFVRDLEMAISDRPFQELPNLLVQNLNVNYKIL